MHCVILGFSHSSANAKKAIYDGELEIYAKNINAYLVDAVSVFIKKATKPICDAPEMVFGSMPNDGGNLIIEGTEYYKHVLRLGQRKQTVCIQRNERVDSTLLLLTGRCLNPFDHRRIAVTSA